VRLCRADRESENRNGIEYIKDVHAGRTISYPILFCTGAGLCHFENAKITPIEGWSDYIYAAEDLKTLKGHRFNKKRNRLNKFLRECEEDTGLQV
jgi:hypothetical protein